MKYSKNINGLLISISGIDGSGKSSQMNLLKVSLENLTKQNVITCHAMKPEIYTDLLNNVAAEFKKDKFSIFGDDMVNICYAVQLLRNIENSIIPAITNNISVITHRYNICCEAYSMLGKCDMKMISRLLSLCPIPDFHFFLDLSPDEAMKRIAKRAIEKNQEIDAVENIISLSKINRNYKQLISEKYKNIICIDTNGKNMEYISNEILNIILQRTIIP